MNSESDFNFPCPLRKERVDSYKTIYVTKHDCQYCRRMNKCDAYLDALAELDDRSTDSE